jgi:iron complex outermembrane recepter protein
MNYYDLITAPDSRAQGIGMIDMKSIRFMAASALATTLVIGANPAFAQSSGTAAQPTPETKAAAEETNEIVVVGSRIRRDAFNSAAPVQLITREETTLAGFNSSSEVLQGSSVTGGTAQINNSFGGFVTEGGPGANTLSLRGLGASRTLVLLNGRRIAPAGTRGGIASADLNVLPNAIVDRIEILKDGASSIYGSDAVAGVVNIVTRRKIHGVTLEASYTGTGNGGGNNFGLSVVGGYTGDRFNIVGSFEYLKRTELTLADRDWTQCNTDYLKSAFSNVPGSGDFVDPKTGKAKCYPITATGSNGVTINTLGTPTRAGVPGPGTTGTAFNRWRPNAAVTTGFVGFEGVSLNSRDTFDPRTLNRSLVSPAEIYTGYLSGSYDVQALGNAEFYFDVLGTKRKSSSTGYRQLSLDYPRGSPAIPASIPAFASAFLPGQPNTGGLPVGVRAFIGYGNDTTSAELEFWRVGGGLKGETSISDWRYDLYVGGNGSSASYTFQSFITSRLAQASNVVSNGGVLSCANTANGCVPLPLLTAAVIGGDLPQNFKDFIFRPVTGTSTFYEQNAALTFDGTLFSLPYGKVKSVIGFEYRRSKIDDTPPIESQTGDLFNLTSAAITRGRDSVWEIFGETEVPLLRKLNFAEDLTLNVSGRYTNYKSYGSGWTYKVGGTYSPFKFMSLRGTYGTSYRAPALSEQFQGATTGFLAQSNDPCAEYGLNGRDVSNPVRFANCRSEGLPSDFLATSGITVINSGGAAAGLKAETSRNFTVGLVLQPSLGNSFGNLSFAVDYSNIKVSNGVSRAGAGNLLQLCYDDPQFRAGGSFCRLVSNRAAGTNALTVRDSFINLATDVVRVIDYNLRYTRDLGQGELRLTAEVTQFLEQSNKLFATDDLDDLNGTLNNPKFTGNFDVNYKIKKWQFRYGLEWIQKTQSYTYFGIDPATTLFTLDAPNYFLHNVSVQYKTDKLSITAGVRNMFDKEPPQISIGRGYNRIGNAPLYSGYDYVGRRFFVKVAKSF